MKKIETPLTRPSATLSPLRGATGKCARLLALLPACGEKVPEGRMRGVVYALLAALAFSIPAFAGTGCVGVAISSDQSDGGKFGTTFSATQIVDVDFSILFPPGVAKQFAGDHLVEFRIFTPRGGLYQSVTIPFTSDTNRAGQLIHVEGYPDPQALHLLGDVTYNNAKHSRVFVRLPVAATPIITNSLYGTWSAGAYVDGDAISCSKPASFVITQ